MADHFEPLYDKRRYMTNMYIVKICIPRIYGDDDMLEDIESYDEHNIYKYFKIVDLNESFEVRDLVKMASYGMLNSFDYDVSPTEWSFQVIEHVVVKLDLACSMSKDPDINDRVYANDGLAVYAYKFDIEDMSAFMSQIYEDDPNKKYGYLAKILKVK